MCGSINRLYLEICNSSQKQCLTIYTRDVNDLGPAKFRTQADSIYTRDVNDLRPAKFRTQADSDTEQIYCYNRNKKDTSLNSFLALRKETPSTIKITFSIVKVIDETNKHNSIYSESSNELSNFKNDNFQRTIQQISENDIDRDDKKLERRRRELTIAGGISKKPRFLSR